MRLSRISRDELLQCYTGTFRHYSHHGTTVEMLPSACGLTRASFYHRYPNKEALLCDVFEWTYQRLAETFFSIAYDPLLAPCERLEKLGRKAARLFQDDSIGCLMGVVTVDASCGRSKLTMLIRSFLNDWAQAFIQLYRPAFDEAQALECGRQSAIDFEGAILPVRVYGEPGYIDNVVRRTLEQLAG